MKILFTLLILLLNFPGAFSQIINGGFENWNGTEPEGWKTSNSGSYTFVSQSNDSHSGSYSLSSTVINFFGINYGGFLMAGSDGKGFLISERYTNLNGYYKFIPADTSDRVSITILIYHFSDSDTTGIGYGISSLGESQNFSEFNVDIFYSNQSLAANLIKITISILNLTSSTGKLGTKYYLDDLQLTNAVGVKESFIKESSYNLHQNYPNPFNPATKIKYSIRHSTPVTLKVFDALGRELKTLVHKTQSPGEYTVDFNGSDLTSGIYFYRLIAGNYVQTKKMIMIK